MIRRFAKDAVIYAIPMFLAKAVGLMLLPIYARQLAPADFGFVEYVAAFSSILLVVLPLEINQAVARLLPESDDRDRQLTILSSTLWFTVLVFGVFGGVIFLGRFQLLEALNLSLDYAQYAALVCAGLFISAIINLLQVHFRFTDQAKSSVAVNMAVVFTNLGLALHFSFTARLGIDEYFISQAVGGITGVGLGFWILIKKHGRFYFYIDLGIIRKLLRFSFPIMLSSIGVVLSGSVDRLIIGSLEGLTDLGNYGVAMRFATIFSLGFFAVNSAIAPIVYSTHEKVETKRLIATVFQFTIYVSMAILILITFQAELIMNLIAGEQFIGAANYMFFLMLSALISSLYVFFLGMDIAKNTKLLSYINLSAGALGTIGCVTLIPIIGIWGAITSTLVAGLVRLFAYVYFSQKLYPVSFAFRWPLVLAASVIAFNLFKVVKP